MPYTSSVLVIAIASTENNGNNTPVIKNPIVAISQLRPANCPKCSGKIKFPAPKNSAKIIEAITKYCLKFNFCINFVPPI
jgi:hypothetical protein